jgi:hypothetical protein
MDSNRKEHIVNRIFNSIFLPKAKTEWGVDLNLKLKLESDDYYDKWSFELLSVPNKLVVKNPDENGWNEDRYWFVSRLIRHLISESLDYSGIYNDEDTFPRKKVVSTFLLDRLIPSDIKQYYSEYINKETSERNAQLPSFIIDNYGNVTSKKLGVNYNLAPNGRILDEEWYFLGDIENPDWWDELDNDTKREFVKYFG